MTADESLALKYHTYTVKTTGNSKMRQILVDKGLISEREDIKDLLKPKLLNKNRSERPRLNKIKGSRKNLRGRNSSSYFDEKIRGST